MVVVVTTLLAWVLVSQGLEALTLTGEVDQGLPAWQLPWTFNVLNSTSVNSFEETVSELGAGLAMLPLVSVLQHLAIAKHYAGNQQMAASQGGGPGATLARVLPRGRPPNSHNAEPARVAPVLRKKALPA